ncbi:MAG: hypothetical protein IPH44_38900 [Myxococcales bacterium]|nr:hypothetical protein [Myxococcales bacterium]
MPWARRAGEAMKISDSRYSASICAGDGSPPSAPASRSMLSSARACSSLSPSAPATRACA